MDYLLQVLLPLLCFSLWFGKLCFSGHGSPESAKLPPGPKPLPLVGNILQLTDQPHRALCELSRTYGPLMYLKLGSVRTLVVSSSSMAAQVFLNNDLALSSRKIPDGARALDHDSHSVAWMPVSPKWRSLRKICGVLLFSPKRLDASQCIRHHTVEELLSYITQCCEKGEAVGVGEVGFTATLNLLSNTFFSMDLAAYNSSAAQELKGVIRRIFDCVGRPNFADFFPFLTYFDPLRIRRDTAASFALLFQVFDDMISQRLSGSVERDDVLQTLLDIRKEEGSDLSHDDIKHLLLDLLAAGTDTTSSTIEWGMTELLRNPTKMAKAQAELDEVLGRGTAVQESDIGRLPYLQAVVKETMRLHPSLPFLLPHKAKDEIQLCDYIVPKDTQVLVNAWAIGRDPEAWKNPSEFLPDRFLKSGVDVRGQHMELIPFGAGRRICAGMGLAYRNVHLILAAMIHGFGWRLADGLTKEDVDMSEKFGLSLEKATPLIAVPLPK